MHPLQAHSPAFAVQTPDLLEQLESNLTKLGVRLHWVEIPKEVCCIIHSIVMHHQGKLMVSEEIELNHYLAECGIKAVKID
ncbi:iron-sulfur protein [Helicobacter pametensis]|nr:iron-sulfur protein [Helicobacter pametensis]